jgi:hypothetical protein
MRCCGGEAGNKARSAGRRPTSDRWFSACERKGAASAQACVWVEGFDAPVDKLAVRRRLQERSENVRWNAAVVIRGSAEEAYPQDVLIGIIAGGGDAG